MAKLVLPCCSSRHRSRCKRLLPWSTTTSSASQLCFQLKGMMEVHLHARGFMSAIDRIEVKTASLQVYTSMGSWWPDKENCRERKSSREADDMFGALAGCFLKGWQCYKSRMFAMKEPVFLLVTSWEDVNTYNSVADKKASFVWLLEPYRISIGFV